MVSLTEFDEILLARRRGEAWRGAFVSEVERGCRALGDDAQEVMHFALEVRALLEDEGTDDAGGEGASFFDAEVAPRIEALTGLTIETDAAGDDDFGALHAALDGELASRPPTARTLTPEHAKLAQQQLRETQPGEGATPVGIPFFDPSAQLSWGWHVHAREVEGAVALEREQARRFQLSSLSTIWRAVLDHQGDRTLAPWPADRLWVTPMAEGPVARASGASAHLAIMISAWLEVFRGRIDGLASIWATGKLDHERGLEKIQGVAAKAEWVLEHVSGRPGLHLFVAPELNRLELREVVERPREVLVEARTLERGQDLLDQLLAMQPEPGESAVLFCHVYPPLEHVAVLLNTLRLFATRVSTGPEIPRRAQLRRTLLPADAPTTGCLVHLNASPRPVSYALRPGVPLSIGRSEACDVTVGHPYVSRQHCMLELDDGHVTVTNESPNGLFLPSRMLLRGDAVKLERGALMRIQSELFRVALGTSKTAVHEPGLVDPVTGLTRWSALERPAMGPHARISFEWDEHEIHLASALDDEVRTLAPWRAWALETLRRAHPGCALYVAGSGELVVGLEPVRGWTQEAIERALEHDRSTLTSLDASSGPVAHGRTSVSPIDRRPRHFDAVYANLETMSLLVKALRAEVDALDGERAGEE